MNQLSLIAILTGFIFFVCGWLFRFFPPKHINVLYGYRTRASMRNPETWMMANRYASQLLWQLGLVLMIIGAITFPLQPTVLTGKFAGIVLILLMVLLTYYFTEKHIRKHFDEHGKRRD